VHKILFLTFIIFQVHVVGTELLFASVAMVRGSYCGGGESIPINDGAACLASVTLRFAPREIEPRPNEYHLRGVLNGQRRGCPLRVINLQMPHLF